jgi:hypothetical protein
MQPLLARYRLILPSEHGSWSLTFVPFIIGAGVGGLTPAPGALPATLLCLITVLALFLARQPLNLWLRITRGRGRRSDRPTALFWSAALLIIAALSGAGMLALGRRAVLWLALPALITLITTLTLTAVLGPRRLITELIGVAGLALSAPAAIIAMTGHLDALTAIIWALSAIHNLISVLYVRLRIDERHGRASREQAAWVITAHTLSLLAVIAAALLDWLPWPVTIPIGLLLIRTLIIAYRRPPITSVKRFGFTEAGLSLTFALIVIASFLLT